MKNFIKSQENIIKEIYNEDSNYIETSLSFIEKTLKTATNEINKSAYDLIEEYITDDKLLDAIHKLRMDANQIKHHKNEEFDYHIAMNYLKVLNQYLDFIQNKFNDAIETTDFIKLYDKTKKEIEKKKVVEKTVNVVKKEFITIEKPIYKKIIKEKNDIDNNIDYTEVQLLNESNNKGLLYNAIYLKKFDYAVDILSKRIKHNIILSSDEEEIINNNIKAIYKEIKYQLTDETIFLYFDDELIINMIMIEKDINLIYQYISLKNNYNLLNDKLYKLLEYYIDNNDDAVKIIISFKNKFKPIEKLRSCISKHMSVSKIINFFNLFESDDIKNDIDFNKLFERYNLEYNEKLVKYVEKYRWGRFLVVDDYIKNKNTIVTYETFEQNYLKINDNEEINESIITSNNENALNIIKAFDEKNIPMFNNVCKYISRSDGTLSEYNLSKVNREYIKYYINKNYFKSDTLINGLFIYYLNKLDCEIVGKLIDTKLFNEKIFYQYDFDGKISNDKEYELMLKFYAKNGFIPTYFIANMYEYNYELSCQKLNKYLSNNILLLTRFMQHFVETNYYRYHEKTYYFNSGLRLKILKTLVTEENGKDNLISIFKTIIRVLDSIEYDGSKAAKKLIILRFAEILVILNKKDIYLKDVLNHKLIDGREDFFQNLFEENLELLNNLDKNKQLPIFSNSFIIDHYDSEYIKIILNNRKESVGSLIRDAIEVANYDVIKKLADLGLDFTKINDGVIKNKIDKVYDYDKTKKYDSAFDFYRSIHYSHDDNIYCFLAYIKVKQFIENQKFILERNIEGHDFLDDLLINEEVNRHALKLIQDEYELKTMYDDFLKTPSKSFNDFKKKLFINSDYLNDKCNYNELLELNISEINKLSIQFDILKNIFNYYYKLNDSKRIIKLRKINNKEFLSYINKKLDLLGKLDTETKEDNLEVPEIKNNDVLINKQKQKSASGKKKIDFGAMVVITVAQVLVHVVCYSLFAALIALVIYLFKIEYYNIDFKNLFFIFLGDLLIEFIAFLAFRSKLFDEEKIVISSIIIVILFTTISVFVLNNKYGNDFYKNLEISSTYITDKCTIIILKNNNSKTHSFDFGDVSLGYNELYTGSNKKNYYGNEYSYNKLVASSNINEVKNYCNINYELINPVVYRSKYESRVCGGADNRYNCSGYIIADYFVLSGNEEVTLVFDTINSNYDLTINGRIIK